VSCVWTSSLSVKWSTGIAGGEVFRVRTGVVGSSGISSIGVEGSAACWGEDRSTTGVGGSDVTSRNLSQDRREGWVPGQATLSRNFSMEWIDPGGATTCKLSSKIICHWWMLWSMASKHWESLWAGTEGAAEVDAGVGVADVEGNSAGLAFTLVALRIETVRSLGFQQFFLM